MKKYQLLGLSRQSKNYGLTGLIKLRVSNSSRHGQGMPGFFGNYGSDVVQYSVTVWRGI